MRHARLPLRWLDADTAHLDLLDAGDVPWIAELVAAITARAGLHWREVSELADAKWRGFVARALERACGEAADPGIAPAAPAIRARLFGAAAVDAADRAARIAQIAGVRGTTPEGIERAMLADLRTDARVEIPAEVPSPSALATAANIAALARVFERAHEIRIARDDQPAIGQPGRLGGASPRAVRALAADLVTFPPFRLEATCDLRARGAPTTIHARSSPNAITLAAGPLPSTRPRSST